MTVLVNLLYLPVVEFRNVKRLLSFEIKKTSKLLQSYKEMIIKTFENKRLNMLKILLENFVISKIRYIIYLFLSLECNYLYTSYYVCILYIGIVYAHPKTV